MHKRRLVAIAIALMLTLVTTAMWSASTIVREGRSRRKLPGGFRLDRWS